jgi:chromosome segregation ATPase
MDELFKKAKKMLKEFADEGFVSAQAMVEYEKCNERISKIGRYIAEHGRNEEQLKQIREFLKSINNLFDEFIKDLD